MYPPVAQAEADAMTTTDPEEARILAEKIAEALLPHESEERRRFGALALVLPLLTAAFREMDERIAYSQGQAESAIYIMQEWKTRAEKAEARVRVLEEQDHYRLRDIAERDAIIGRRDEALAASEARVKEAEGLLKQSSECGICVHCRDRARAFLAPQPSPAPEAPAAETPDLLYCGVTLNPGHWCGNLKPCSLHPQPERHEFVVGGTGQWCFHDTGRLRYDETHILCGKPESDPAHQHEKPEEPPRHICGLTGFNPMIDPPCPGCADLHGEEVESGPCCDDHFAPTAPDEQKCVHGLAFSERCVDCEEFVAAELAPSAPEDAEKLLEECEKVIVRLRLRWKDATHIADQDAYWMSRLAMLALQNELDGVLARLAARRQGKRA